MSIAINADLCGGGRILNYLEGPRASFTLESVALYTGEDMQLMQSERADRLTAVRITDDFLPTLGVQPVLGRNFHSSEVQNSARVWTAVSGTRGFNGTRISLSAFVHVATLS